LTSTPVAKRSAHFTPDSKEVYYLDRGRLFNVTLEKREPRSIAVAAELDVDVSREKMAAFREAWIYLRDQFFDEKMNGVDWTAVRTTNEPRVAGARTPDEMRRIISMMLGELNASHMGIAAPPQATQISLGRLAADFDSAEYETSGRLRVAAVVPLGPGALAGLKAGDYIRQVDGHDLLQADGRAAAGRASLDELLDHTVGKRIALSSTRSTCSRGAATSTCCRAGPVGVVAIVARPARARAGDDPRHQPTLAVGRRGFHRGLPHAEAGQGRRRAE
jgi:tricorn protease